MDTWIVGDVLGRARELRALLDRLPRHANGLAPRVIAAGNLVHGGPDPLGVVELCEARGVRFVLGAHERAVLERLALAPRAGRGRGARPSCLPLVTADQLRGEDGAPCDVDEEGAERVLEFMLGHDGYVLRSSALGAAPAPDGRDWCVVHAGVAPGGSPEAQDGWHLTHGPRLERAGAPRWQEGWRGAELIVHGHELGAQPRRSTRAGRLVAVALGLRDGLAAYSPALDRFVAVPGSSGRSSAAFGSQRAVASSDGDRSMEAAA